MKWEPAEQERGKTSCQLASQRMVVLLSQIVTEQSNKKRSRQHKNDARLWSKKILRRNKKQRNFQ